MHTHVQRASRWALALGLVCGLQLPLLGREIQVHDYLLTQGKKHKQARYIPWSGDWWNMDDGDLAMGRQEVDDKSYTYDEETHVYTEVDAVDIKDWSPMRKFDAYVERKTGVNPGVADLELKGKWEISP